MKEEELEKMLKELEEIRKSYRSKTLTSVKPTGSSSHTFGVNMDFASLYPSTMTMKFPSKQNRRMKKIKKMYD
jgi:intein-encoded DNA endonuclease-like protein